MEAPGREVVSKFGRGVSGIIKSAGKVLIRTLLQGKKQHMVNIHARYNE